MCCASLQRGEATEGGLLKMAQETKRKKKHRIQEPEDLAKVQVEGYLRQWPKESLTAS